MPMTCCVRGCTWSTKLHTFPKENEMLQVWCRNIGREDLLQKDYAKIRSGFRVCDLHFTEEFQLDDRCVRARKKQGSVPTINIPGFTEEAVVENSFYNPSSTSSTSSEAMDRPSLPAIEFASCGSKIDSEPPTEYKIGTPQKVYSSRRLRGVIKKIISPRARRTLIELAMPEEDIETLVLPSTSSSENEGEERMSIPESGHSADSLVNKLELRNASELTPQEDIISREAAILNNIARQYRVNGTSLQDHLRIFFDEVDKISILDYEVAKETNDLKEECQIYLEKIDEFHKIADKFVAKIGHLAGEVQKQKIQAIQSMEKQKEKNQQQLQALIAEKSVELELLKVQLNSLQKNEIQPNEITIEITH